MCKELTIPLLFELLFHFQLACFNRDDGKIKKLDINKLQIE